MSKRILIDAAHPEEVRVALIDRNNRLEELDIETATKKNLRGNIYLAKITRVEPSLQAAFVEYGGNRHGFLPFSEIHSDYFQISEDQRKSVEDGMKKAKDSRRKKNDPKKSKESEKKNAKEEKKVKLDDEIKHSPKENVTSKSEPKEDIISKAASSDLGAPRFVTVVNKPTQQEVAKTGGDIPPEADLNVEEEFPTFHNRYKIQEVIKNNQILLIQISKEERGTKGAAITTNLTLAGRYCVLMPNTASSGGVSRKITSLNDRKRLKEVIEELNLPETMSMIVRTAGSDRNKEEIKDDARYLCRLWEKIRELTLTSTSPSLIYDEPNLIQRSIRDLYNKDVEKIMVEGSEGFSIAKDFVKDLMPSQNSRLSLFRNNGVPLFQYFNVENQIDEMRLPQVTMESGGSIVINQTEALVAIDINSGKSTRSHHIKETALRTNLESVSEIARQLRLRDLAGLIVIDFIDMDDPNHIRQVENRMREVMSNDRARVQIGQISPFGLLEMSRQRMRPSILESSYLQCPNCKGKGVVRSISASSIEVLRAISDEAASFSGDVMGVMTPREVGYYLLNYKRDKLYEIEQRYNKMILIKIKSTLIAPDFEFEHSTVDKKTSRSQQVTNIEAETVINSRKRAASKETPISQDPRSANRRRGRRGGTKQRKPEHVNNDQEKKKSWWQKLIG